MGIRTQMSPIGITVKSTGYMKMSSKRRENIYSIADSQSKICVLSNTSAIAEDCMITFDCNHTVLVQSKLTLVEIVDIITQGYIKIRFYKGLHR